MEEPDKTREKLAAFDAALKQAEADQAPKPMFVSLKAGDTSGFAKAGRVAFELVIAMMVGLFLGWACDRALDTLPFLMLLGGFLGFAGGVWNAWRAMNGKNI